MADGRRGTRTDVVVRNEVALLRTAGLRDRSLADQAWLDFRRNVPSGQETLVERRLLPAVFRNRHRLDLETEPGIRRAYAEAFGANARILAQAAPALRSLQEAGIPTLVLKGTALLVAHYVDLGARPMSDVDILVPEDRIADALAALEGSGWRGDPERRWLATGAHAGTVISTEGLNVDLHRYATCEARFHEANDAFFARAVPVEVSRVPTTAMSPGDQLLHTVVHGLRWSIAPSSIWILDCLTLLRGRTLDVPATVSTAADLRLLAALQQGLELVREIFGEEETLDHLLRELRSRVPERWERVEQWFRVREPAGALGALPNLWFAHGRSGPGGRPSAAGFPSFLKRTWSLEPDHSLARLMVAKAGRRIRTVLPGLRGF